MVRRRSCGGPCLRITAICSTLRTIALGFLLRMLNETVWSFTSGKERLSDLKPS